jgi:hypothetical protein
VCGGGGHKGVRACAGGLGGGGARDITHRPHSAFANTGSAFTSAATPLKEESAAMSLVEAKPAVSSAARSVSR